MAYLIDSDTSGSGSIVLSGTNVCKGVAQAFLVSHASVLNSASFKITKVGSPTGAVTVKLYSMSGVYGTTAIPGSLLATSDSIDASLMPAGAYQLFNFSGGAKINLLAATNYVVSLEYSVNDISNNITAGADGGNTHPGNSSWQNYTTGVWSANSTTIDAMFNVYGTITSPLPPYYES